MINLSYEQKVNIGFQFIIDSLGVFSPYGQELARDCKPYTKDEKQELKTELDNVELIIKNRDKIQQEVMKLQRTFMSIKDVKNIIANINNQILDDVGLFELKNFLIYSEEIRLALNKIKSIIKLKNIDINNLEEALNIIDIAGKGATFYGVSMATSMIVQAIFDDENAVIPVSHVIEEGEYAGVAFSLPCIINRTGIVRVIQLPLNDEEKEGMAHSADVLRESIAAAE